MEQQTAMTAAIPAAAQTMAPPPAAPAGPRRRKKRAGRIAAALLVLALLGGSGGGVWYFVFRQPPEDRGEVLTDVIRTGSITTAVEGSGLATPRESATLTLAAGGTVSQVFVSDGDTVSAGDPLYIIRSEAAEEEVAAAREAYNARLEEIAALQKERAGLTLQAPHPGKLIEVKRLQPGDELSRGDTVATLVNDTKLRLHLYYNYSYQGAIQKGQSAEISIPAVMGTFPGTVEAVNLVSRIFPEGGKGFEVVFALDNPDTLTAGMEATALLTAGDGGPIYPYESGKLEYWETTELKVKASGPVTGANLLNYAAVSAGTVLVTLGDTELGRQIAEKQALADEAAKKLTEAQKAMADLSAAAPISGTVFSCSLLPGQEAKAGETAVIISNTAVMSVEITVDDRSIRAISVGQDIEFTDYEENTYTGTVESVSLSGKSENGMTTYPVKVTVDNADGRLVSGAYLNYSFAASQSGDCLVAPVEAVRSVSGAGGSLVSVVFVQSDRRPDNGVDLPAEVMGEIPAGFYPVPVETGLSDPAGVEIKSGVSEGDTVFLGYQKDAEGSSI